MSISATQRARLGVFMIAGSALLFVFFAIPVGLRLSEQEKTYYSTFRGESLSGLAKGSEVRFYGLKIGRVEQISYDAKNILEVRVEMKVEHDFPMKEDMYCQTGAIAITGLKYIDIQGGTNEAALLPSGAEIRSVPSLIAHITGKAEVIIAKIEVLLNNINQLSNPDSLTAIKTILDNVAELTTDARGFFSAVRPDIESATRSFESVVGKVDGISTDVKTITAEASRSFSQGRLASIMHSIDSTALALKRLSDDVSMMIRQSREDIMVSAENLREALENANELTKILAENPSLLLKGDQQKERDVR